MYSLYAAVNIITVPEIAITIQPKHSGNKALALSSYNGNYVHNIIMGYYAEAPV